MAGKDTNVIRLDSVTELPVPESVPERALPVRIHTLDFYRHFLPPLFDQTDDTLFSMSGHATLHGEQTLLFDGMRALRMQKQGICERFLAGISHWFEPGDHLRDQDRKSESNLSEVRVEKLSLVGEEDLEERLAIAGLKERISQGECGKQMTLLNRRLSYLYEMNELSVNCSPVGPVAAGRIFLSVIEPLELPLKIRLVVLKIFEQACLQQAEEFFRKLNNELRDANVCPDLEQKMRQERAQNAKDANGCLSGSVSQNGPEQKNVPTDAHAQVSTPQSEPVNETPSSPPAAPPQNIQTSVMDRQELMGLLSLIQSHQPGIEPGGHIAPAPGLRETMDIALAGTQGSKVLDSQDSELINVVSTLFEFILDDHDLSDTIKALIGRLQVPVLKLAILDKNFFSSRNHPARLLLNSMASAGGLRQGDAQNKRLALEIEKVVFTILQEFSTDISLFERALKSFQKFMDEEKRRVGRFEQRMKEAEEAKQRSEQARLEVQDTIDQHIGGRTLPEAVGPLLHEAWSSYLFIISLKQGRSGNTWERAVHVVDHIAASVQPCKTSEEIDRRKVLLPKLYSAIELGLNSISYDPCLIELYLNHLKEIHSEQESCPEGDGLEVISALEALDEVAAAPDALVVGDTKKTETIESPEQEKAAQPKAPPSQSVPDKKEFNQKLQNWQPEEEQEERTPFDEDDLEEMEEEVIVMESSIPDQEFEAIATTAPASEETTIDLSSLKVGVNVEFVGETGTKTCRLSEISSNGHFIFKNANGLRVADKTRSQVEQSVQSGVIKLPVSSDKEDQAFDRAIQSVMGNFKLFGDRKSP